MSGGVGKVFTQGILDNPFQAGLVAPNSLIDSTPKAPETLKPIEKAQVMPTINQDKIKKAKISALQSLQARTGRASTLLTSTATTDKFGG